VRPVQAGHRAPEAGKKEYPMPELVSYRLEDQIAWITMDDGKANVLSPEMQRQIGAALDRAESDGAVVVLRGRPGIFSGGFDLNVLRGGGADALDMLRGGFRMSIRLLSFPRPVVIVCTGHAIAMGVFTVLSGDYRIGTAGPFRIVANEVAIGMTMPYAAIEVLKQRLTRSAFQRALILAEVFSPESAVPAGFLDAVVSADELESAAREKATALAALDRNAHAESKLRARQEVLDAIRAGIDRDFGADGL
jgi:enoyl-CoA hydratase